MTGNDLVFKSTADGASEMKILSNETSAVVDTLLLVAVVRDVRVAGVVVKVVAAAAVVVVAVVDVVVVVVVEATSLSGSFVVCSTDAQFPERCDFNSPTSIPGALYALQYCACLSKWQHCTPLIVLQKARQAWFVKSNMNDRAKSVSLLATVQTRFIVNALHVTVKCVSLLSVTTAAKVVVVAVDVEGVVVSGPADCAAAGIVVSVVTLVPNDVVGGSFVDVVELEELVAVADVVEFVVEVNASALIVVVVSVTTTIGVDFSAAEVAPAVVAASAVLATFDTVDVTPASDVVGRQLSLAT